MDTWDFITSVGAPTPSPTETSAFYELRSGWLTTAASQIFLMQLGFTAFEVGFVENRWAKSFDYFISHYIHHT